MDITLDALRIRCAKPPSRKISADAIPFPYRTLTTPAKLPTPLSCAPLPWTWIFLVKVERKRSGG